MAPNNSASPRTPPKTNYRQMDETQLMYAIARCIERLGQDLDLHQSMQGPQNKEEEDLYSGPRAAETARSRHAEQIDLPSPVTRSPADVKKFSSHTRTTSFPLRLIEESIFRMVEAARRSRTTSDDVEGHNGRNSDRIVQDQQALVQDSADEELEAAGRLSLEAKEESSNEDDEELKEAMRLPLEAEDDKQAVKHEGVSDSKSKAD